MKIVWYLRYLFGPHSKCVFLSAVIILACNLCPRKRIEIAGRHGWDRIHVISDVGVVLARRHHGVARQRVAAAGVELWRICGVCGRASSQYCTTGVHSCLNYYHNYYQFYRIVYLGSVFPSDDYCRPDINSRIGRASSVMLSLHHIWKNRRLSLTESK